MTKKNILDTSIYQSSFTWRGMAQSWIEFQAERRMAGFPMQSFAGYLQDNFPMQYANFSTAVSEAVDDQYSDAARKAYKTGKA